MTTQTPLPRVLVADERHGPLPVLLLGLTALAGIVDAVSILALGRVFVANMTGNVVFIGFAVAGAAGFSLAASLLGLTGFIVGAGAGGRLIGSLGSDRARLLTAAVSLEFVLFAVATVVVALSGQPVSTGSRDVAIVVLAAATGVQNAIARRLAVPDLTTTVLTMTLTGLAADIRAGLRTSASGDACPPSPPCSAARYSERNSSWTTNRPRHSRSAPRCSRSSRPRRGTRLGIPQRGGHPKEARDDHHRRDRAGGRT